jgi:hypothetical protein
MKYLLLLLLLIPSIAFTQIRKDTLICIGLETANARGSINDFGFSYGKYLYISKDSLKNAFTVTISDPSYKVIGFTIIYFGVDGDFWAKNNFGAKLTPENSVILKGLKNEDDFEFHCINLERGGKRYNLPGFIVVITE